MSVTIPELESLRRATWRAIRAGLILALAPLLTTAAETWRKVVAPEFTLITSLSEREAQEWAGEFAQFTVALRAQLRITDQLPPLTIVVFARNSQFEGYRPLGENGKAKDVGGFFYRSGSWAVAGMGGSWSNEENRRTFLHEGVHWFVNRTDRTYPVWYDEGLAEVFSTFVVRDKEAQLGRAIDRHPRLLHTTPPMPVERLLRVRHEDLFVDTHFTEVVYAESWTLVHYLLFGRHEISDTAMNDYLSAKPTAPSDEAAFRAAFGLNFAEMDKRLAQYLSGGRYLIYHRALAVLPTLTVKAASPAEVELALGRLALGSRRSALARAHAETAIAAAPTEPFAHELMAAICSSDGPQARVRAELGRAVECGSTDFRTYFDLAQIQYSDNTGGGPNALDSVAARQIADGYNRTIELNAAFLPAYQNLAGVLSGIDSWTAADRMNILSGRKRFPDDVMLKVAEALLVYRDGDRTRARGLLGALLTELDVKGGPARTFAHRLDEGWLHQEIVERIDTLLKGEQFADAVAYIDEQLSRGVEPNLRRQLVPMRTDLRAEILSHRVDGALAEKHWADARRAIAEYLALDLSPKLKAQMQSTLDQLDAENLGLENGPVHR